MIHAPCVFRGIILNPLKSLLYVQRFGTQISIFRAKLGRPFKVKNGKNEGFS